MSFGKLNIKNNQIKIKEKSSKAKSRRKLLFFYWFRKWFLAVPYQSKNLCQFQNIEYKYENFSVTNKKIHFFLE